MALYQNLRHRRAVAAVHRRAPVPEPQLGFDPTAIFGGRTRKGNSGKDSTDIFLPDTSTTDTPVASTTSQETSATSSETSTSSSSSTLPTTTSVTPTTTTSVAPPPPTSTSDVITTMPTKTAVVTLSLSRTSSSTTSSASATNTADSSTGMSTGAVVGGIGAGIIAIAAIGVAIVFFIRRSRKHGNNFDSNDFRRSAVLLDDPPTHDDTVSRGFNPRPPTMIERLATPAPTFGTQYGQPGPAYNEYPGEYADNRAAYGASNFQSTAPGQVVNSFAPGQVLNMNNCAPSPISASSAHPMYPNPGYAQSPFLPASLPIAPQSQHADQEHSQYGQPSASVAPYPVLTRQGSASSHGSQHRRLPTPTEIQRESAPSDYVDLDRSSVSPFQAKQYEEISLRLNAEVPTGLPPVVETEKELPPPPDPSTFADPGPVPASPGGQYAIDRRNLERPNSDDSLTEPTLEFPVPPSPAHTVSSRYRIDSTPPTLPEISVDSAGNSLARNSQMGVSPGLTPGHGSRFPITPSPLASSFAMPSPLPNGGSSFPDSTAPAEPSLLQNQVSAPEAAATKETNQNVKKRTTIYDAEDAYGGI